MSLSTLNSSGTQQSNPALYQTINDLIIATDKIQKEIAALGLSVGGNQGLNAALPALNLLSGQIKFPVTPNLSIDPNTLDDYREIKPGWTVVDASGAGLIFTNFASSLVKIGSMVFATTLISYPATVSGLPAALGGLPYTIEPNTNNHWGAVVTFNSAGVPVYVLGIQGTKTMNPFTAAGVNFTNAQLANVFLGLVAIWRTNE